MAILVKKKPPGVNGRYSTSLKVWQSPNRRAEVDVCGFGQTSGGSAARSQKEAREKPLAPPAFSPFKTVYKAKTILYDHPPLLD